MKEELIYTTYAHDTDITFIMKDIIENEETISTEVIGFYYGTEDEDATKEYSNHVKAEF